MPVSVNGHSARELEYREKSRVRHHGEMGRLPRPRAERPEVAGTPISVPVLVDGRSGVRATGDFMVSIQGADGSPGDADEVTVPSRSRPSSPSPRAGRYSSPLPAWSYRPQEHYSLGCSGGVGTSFDPWDPVSFEAAREYLEIVYDPDGPVRAGTATPTAGP